MTVTTAYPVRVDARLDPHLSRWLWLVKWILAIPHFIVLIPLWIAFCVVSVIAVTWAVVARRFGWVDYGEGDTGISAAFVVT